MFDTDCFLFGSGFSTSWIDHLFHLEIKAILSILEFSNLIDICNTFHTIDRPIGMYNIIVFIRLGHKYSVRPNQVSVSRTETKVQFRYRYWSQFFFQNWDFFQIISNFLMLFCFLGGYKFLKAWNWTQIFKNNLKILNIWQQIWFKGPFYDWKKYPVPLMTRFFLSNVISVLVTVSDQNQNTSGFGRTLVLLRREHM